MADIYGYGLSGLSGLLGGAGIGQGQLAQQMATQQAYNAAYYGTGVSTVGWDYATTGTTTSVGNISYDQYLRLTNQPQQEKQKPKKCSKAGNILHDLRQEIDDWHGDILRAA